MATRHSVRRPIKMRFLQNLGTYKTFLSLMVDSLFTRALTCISSMLWTYGRWLSAIVTLQHWSSIAWKLMDQQSLYVICSTAPESANHTTSYWVVRSNCTHLPRLKRKNKNQISLGWVRHQWCVHSYVCLYDNDVYEASAILCTDHACWRSRCQTIKAVGTVFPKVTSVIVLIASNMFLVPRMAICYFIFIDSGRWFRMS